MMSLYISNAEFDAVHLNQKDNDESVENLNISDRTYK